MRDVFETIQKVAPSSATVLIEGDSGTGKEGPRYAVEEMTELKMVTVHRS